MRSEITSKTFSREFRVVSQSTRVCMCVCWYRGPVHGGKSVEKKCIEKNFNHKSPGKLSPCFGVFLFLNAFFFFFF